MSSSLRRGSVVSLGSRTTFGYDEEPKYEEMTDEELREALEFSLRTNKVLALENDVFERYLYRHDPQCLRTMSQILETAKNTQRLTAQLASMPSGIPSGMSLGGSSTALSMVRERPIFTPSARSSQTYVGSRRYTGTSALLPSSKSYRITLSHRIEMANKEIDDMKKSLAELEQLAVKKRAELRAQMEEIELRIRETCEAKEELEEVVVKKGVDPLTGKIPAEKFVKFIEEWLKAADSIIEKLRLKSSTLKAQIKKAKSQLRQREELGEALHAIDFQQLAIENQDYVRKIEKKNQDLLELKKITGRYNIALTTHKQKLATQLSTLNSIRKDIETKKSQIDKLQTDDTATRLEVEKAEKQLAHIMQLMEEYTVPDVLDFVKVQAELQEMQKTYKRLERHRKIQMTALKSFKKQQNQLEQIRTDVKSSGLS